MMKRTRMRPLRHDGVRAAWLATNPAVLAEDRAHRPAEQPNEVVVSHRSAAVVHGMGGVLPARHEFTVAGRRTSSHPDVAFHRRSLDADEMVTIDGLLVTSIERTVADLCVPGVDLDHFAELVRDALANEHVDTRRLGYELTPGAKRLGFRTGDALIEECLTRAGLPTPVINTLPLWRTALIRQIQQAVVMPAMDFTMPWTAINLAALSQPQRKQLQEAIEQFALTSAREVAVNLVKEAIPYPEGTPGS